MMPASTQICVLCMTAILCLSVLNTSEATYIDCSMECLFAAFRKPTVCECKNTLKLHWGKRAPRTRTHSLPTFRYGKRSLRHINIDGNRLDTIRSIQDALNADALYDFDV